MDKRQAEVEKLLLEYEKQCLNDLQKTYTEALGDVKSKLRALLGREPSPSVAYQVEFQKTLQSQIENALDMLKRGNITSVTDFLNKTYEDGYLGTVYSIQGQGIPLNIGIDHKQIARTVNRRTDTMQFSQRLYDNVEQLGTAFKSQMARGIANNSGYSKIAKQLALESEASYKQAMRIVRTEGGRVKSEAKLDSMKKAKDEGADIVKQWDATFDNKTRAEHRFLDGQIREIGEPFEDSQGRKAQAPHKFGIASMDVNCRCIVVERARWALEGEEMPTKMDNTTGEIVEAKNYREWKEKYQRKQAEQAQPPNNASVFDKNTNKLPNKGDLFKMPNNDLVKIVEVNDFNGVKSVTLENGQTIVLGNLNGGGTAARALTSAQKAAVDYYVSGDGMYINHYLRDGDKAIAEMGPMRENDLKLIEDLDGATDRILEPQTVYRSVDASAVFGDMSTLDYENLRGRVLYNDNSKFAVATDKYIDDAVGKTITEKGFMSTTTDYEVARDFGGFTGSEKPIVLEIKTSSGTKGLSLAKEIPDLEARMEQSEILLKRGQKYKITSISGRDGNIYVNAEMIDEAESVVEKITKLSTRNMPAAFTDSKRTATQTQRLVDFVNGIEGNDNDAKAILANLGKLENYSAQGIDFKITYGADSQLLKRAKVINHEAVSATLNIPKLDGEDITGAANTTLHEMGHLVDSYAGTSGKQFGNISTNAKLMDAIKEGVGNPNDEIMALFKQANSDMEEILKATDVSAQLKNINEIFHNGGFATYSAYSKAFNKTRREALAKRDYLWRNKINGANALQDIYDALSGGAWRDDNIIKFGHGRRYYADRTKRNNEIFANYFSLSITRPDLIEMLRRDKPRLCAALDEILAEIAKGVK